MMMMEMCSKSYREKREEKNATPKTYGRKEREKTRWKRLWNRERRAAMLRPKTRKRHTVSSVYHFICFKWVYIRIEQQTNTCNQVCNISNILSLPLSLSLLHTHAIAFYVVVLVKRNLFRFELTFSCCWRAAHFLVYILHVHCLCRHNWMVSAKSTSAKERNKGRAMRWAKET